MTILLSLTQGLGYAATLADEESGRCMEVFTSEPALHVYTGNYLPEKTGSEEMAIKPRYGTALETQHLPDSPNRPDFPSVVLTPDETFASTTIFMFGLTEG